MVGLIKAGHLYRACHFYYGPEGSIENRIEGTWPIPYIGSDFLIRTSKAVAEPVRNSSNHFLVDQVENDFYGAPARFLKKRVRQGLVWL